MAKFSDTNFMSIGGSSQTASVWFRIKAQAKLAGYTVPRSSDGLTYNSSGYQITVDATGPGGIRNHKSWFVLRDPAGRREFCVMFDIASGQQGIRFKFSELSRFTGGSPAALVTPSAADERIVFAGGTDAAPTFGTWMSTGTVYRTHVIFNSTPIGGVYPICVFNTTGSGQAAGQFIVEPMAPGSYDASDVSPLAMCCDAGSGLPVLGGWLGYGTGSQTWATFSAGDGPYNGTMPVELLTGKDPNGRPYYTASSGGVRMKGYGTTLAAKGCARSYPATCNTATDAGCYLNARVYPYPENVAPLI